MSSNQRLRAPYGAAIDRQKAISFEFDGKPYQGFEGDTVASALAANGKYLLSRSFKYHRPRGVLTMAGQDANTLVQAPENGNALADCLPIHNGLSVQSQNTWGSLENDRFRFLGLVSKFLPVGFYYKAFFKPRGMWEKWAPYFRHITGLGRIDESHQPEYYDKQYLFFDVVVVGAGPAGMQSAIQAAKQGAEVLLLDENAQIGGSLNYARLDSEGQKASQLNDQLSAEIQSLSNIRVMTNALCNGYFADNWLAVVQGKRLNKVRAKQVLMCVGAMEQPAVFHNNDLPGVMLNSAALRMMRQYAVAPGSNAVVLTGNNDGYACALELLDAGVNISAVVDLREQPNLKHGLAAGVVDRDVRVITGHAVYSAEPGRSKNHLGSVEVRQITGQGQCAYSGETIPCDVLCMAVGYVPAYQLLCQGGAQLSYDDERALFTLSNLPANVQIVGSVNGVWSVDAVLSDAQAAADSALHTLGMGDAPAAHKLPVDAESEAVNASWPIFPHPLGKEFVDFDEDLQIADIVNATRDGFEHIQLVKRYSTCGMGPSQGRHSALAAARLVADATGKTVAETGVTTARPPFARETIAHNAGRSFYPARRSNMHYRHVEQGAQMMHAGDWYRPAYYGAPAEREACINAEVTNVRNNVGLVDVSTLGGIEVRGADAPEFLNRFYTFGFLKQPVGRARYALLTNEAGVVIDDGVACRLTEQHYYVTATTGGVGRVYQQMLKWNAQWRLDVDIANVTTAWCGVNLAGPASRKVLSALCDDIDLSAENFPYMGVREGAVAGIKCRLLRVGFVGELGFEIHAPQQCGEALWDALMNAGAESGIKPFGVEAQRILRLEKGHIIIGQDTDAMSNPMEVQMGWAVSTAKPFFVGGRSIEELNKAPLNRVLAGFVIEDNSAPIPLESHLVLQGEQMIGRVTSCNFSPTLGKPIGLAYVPPELAEAGKTLCIKSSGGVRVQAQVVELPFYDPESARQEVS